MPKADNRKSPFRNEMPNPTLEDRDTPLFNAIWEEIKSWDKRELAGLAFECAGAATAPLMRDHPEYVFPSERVSAKVADVLRRHGIETSELHGYPSIGESDPEDSLGAVIVGSSQPMPEDEA